MKLTMEDYHDVVRMLYLKYGSSMIPGTLSDEAAEHVIRVGASVLMTRDGFLAGGSFVQAVVDNNLEAAVNRADSVMRKCLVFMTYLKANVRAELELEHCKSPGFQKI